MKRVYLTYKGMFFEGILFDGFIYVGYTRCEFSQDHPKIYRDITKIKGFMKVPACVRTQEVSLNIIPQLYFYSWDNVIFTNGFNFFFRYKLFGQHFPSPQVCIYCINVLLRYIKHIHNDLRRRAIVGGLYNDFT